MIIYVLKHKEQTLTCDQERAQFDPGNKGHSEMSFPAFIKWMGPVQVRSGISHCYKGVWSQLPNN